MFKYEPLPSARHMRLLRIKPAAFEEPIEVELIATSIDEAEPYYGLSYCWGDLSDRTTVAVNGSSSLEVSQNLLQALKRLRKTYDGQRLVLDHDGHTYDQDQAGLVWIDQLCINQRDIAERGHQVKVMGDIYKHAVRTLIWLGEEDEYVNADTFYYMAELARSNADIEYEPNIHGKIADDVYKKLFERPWFSRVWVIQEAVQSRGDPIILCGDFRASWATLADAVSVAHEFQRRWNPNKFDWVCVDFVNTIRKHRARNLDASNDEGHSYSTPENLLFQSAWYFNATDPRDKVYATLALRPRNVFQGINFGELIPDYTRPFLEVYRDAVMNSIESSGSLNLLSDGPPLPALDIPCDERCSQKLTWVPRWERSRATWTLRRKRVSSQYDTQYIQGGILSARAMTTTSRGHKAEMLRCSDKNLIKLRGILVDTVLWSSEPVYSWKWRTTQIIDIWEGVMQEYGAKPDFGAKHLKLAREFAWCWLKADAICSRLIEDSETEHLYKENDDWVLRQLWGCLVHAYERKEHKRSIEQGLVEQYRRRGTPMGGDHPRPPKALKIFVTQSGYVGYGTSSMRKGDDICILFGGPWASALRKCGDTYHFLGDACLPAFLDGHAVSELRRGKRSAEWFTIK